MKQIKPLIISGKEVLPIIEGGKGIGASNGYTSGAFAAAGAVGTISCVNAYSYDADGNIILPKYHGKTRRERHEELIRMGIEGGVGHVKIAHEVSNGKGRIHINVLWEMGGAEQVLDGILEATKGMIHGITCGAGMPYRLSEIASLYNVHYYPIVSSMRAFRALWKRSYSKSSDLLGGVVYEDPWLAGGHNGLSNSENPDNPEDPFARVALIRKFMNEVGLNDVPIIMAGGVWHLKDWENWLNNPDIGSVAFQFGTRPLLTKESPIPDEWKKKLLTLKEGDIYLNKFSPTGFYSSAIKNELLNDLQRRSEMQIQYSGDPEGYMTEPLPVGARGRSVYISPDDMTRAKKYMEDGYDELLRTPDSTVIFVTKSKAREILKDQTDCMGCLSHCRFSNWKDHDDFTTGKRVDPRSFCIQKSLQNAIHGESIDEQLMFAGHNAYKFAKDPLYKNGFIPTVQQLIDRIMIGE